MEWQIPSAQITLAANEIHVWQAQLDDFGPAYVQHLQQFLTVDEINRANRFHFEKDRRRFVTSRGILRTLLGQYLQLHAAHVPLTVTDTGKPILVDSPAMDTLHFNLSHSGGMALFALSRSARLGIDLEEIRPEVMEDAVADRFFAPAEVAALRALPRPDQTAAFFACWTRKEAYLKGIGTGLNLPLDSFEVSIKPNEPPQLLTSRLRPDDVFDWRLYEIPPIPDFAAALAAEGQNLSAVCWQFLSNSLEWFANFPVLQ